MLLLIFFGVEAIRLLLCRLTKATEWPCILWLTALLSLQNLALEALADVVAVTAGRRDCDLVLYLLSLHGCNICKRVFFFFLVLFVLRQLWQRVLRADADTSSLGGEVPRHRWHLHRLRVSMLSASLVFDHTSAVILRGLRWHLVDLVRER